MQGRFTALDPARDGVNWYAYCGGNPVMFVDPWGLSLEDTVYGIAQAIDDNQFGGIIEWVAEQLTGNENRVNDSEYDYYLGRVIGDAVSMLIGAGESVSGIVSILESVCVGGAITVGSGGTLAVGSISIAVGGAAAGTAQVTYGATVVAMSSKNFNSDYEKLSEAKAKQEYKKTVSGSGKEKANDIPSWAKGNAPYVEENGKEFAKRLMDDKYGEGRWKASFPEYSKIKKWGDRGFK